MGPTAVHKDDISLHGDIKMSEFDGHQGTGMKDGDAYLPHHANNEKTQFISIEAGF